MERKEENNDSKEIDSIPKDDMKLAPLLNSKDELKEEISYKRPIILFSIGIFIFLLLLAIVVLIFIFGSKDTNVYLQLANFPQRMSVRPETWGLA